MTGSHDPIFERSHGGGQKREYAEHHRRHSGRSIPFVRQNVSCRGSMLLVLMFGLRCTGPCAVAPESLTDLERRVVKALVALGMTVRPVPPDAVRPTGPDAFEVREDVARAYGADRVVALDLDPTGTTLWATWFTKGVAGPWRVSQVRCRLEASQVQCPKLASALRTDVRPRQAADVDVLGALRAAAPAVGRCVAAEARRPLATRVFGRVDLDLVIAPTGRMKVSAVAPARAARSRLGQCLRTAMGQQDVGRFGGAPIKLRVPVDL